VFTVVRRLVEVVLPDLHGVLMRTARLHEAAWKELFDSSVQQHGIQDHKSAQLFDPDTDYRRYVDGKPWEQRVTLS